jgi:dephospho-CoA kinase
MTYTDLKFIGITGGVGAGKSRILSYLEEKYKAVVIRSDDLARELMGKYPLKERLMDIFSGDKVFDSDGNIDRKKMSALVFNNKEKLELLNNAVHPAVKEEIIKIRNRLEEEGKVNLLVLEAALLLEEHYEEITDQIWYIYASEDTRRKRLKESRGYSDERIDSMFLDQKTEKEFRMGTDLTIDNDGSFEKACFDIDRAVGGLLNE